VLEVKGSEVSDESMRLEWRPFRTSLGLSRVEYKVMALEWSKDEEKLNSPEAGEANQVMARLRRAAEIQGGSLWPKDKCNFRELGIVTASVIAGSAGFGVAAGDPRYGEQQLRSQGSRIFFQVPPAKPGCYCRYFVCGRYAALPPGSLAPLVGAEAPSKVCIWPDEQVQLSSSGSGSIAWEAGLSRVGLWSPILGGGHMGGGFSVVSHSMEVNVTPQNVGLSRTAAPDDCMEVMRATTSGPGHQLPESWHHRS
jgi:hypothetical protein